MIFFSLFLCANKEVELDKNIQVYKVELRRKKIIKKFFWFCFFAGICSCAFFLYRRIYYVQIELGTVLFDINDPERRSIWLPKNEETERFSMFDLAVNSCMGNSCFTSDKRYASNTILFLIVDKIEGNQFEIGLNESHSFNDIFAKYGLTGVFLAECYDRVYLKTVISDREFNKVLKEKLNKLIDEGKYECKRVFEARANDDTNNLQILKQKCETWRKCRNCYKTVLPEIQKYKNKHPSCTHEDVLKYLETDEDVLKHLEQYR